MIEGDAAAALPSPAHKLADENPDLRNAVEAGPGEPPRDRVGLGKNIPPTIAAAEPDRPDSREAHNTLDSGNPARICKSCGVELQPHEIELCDRCGAPAVLPYPVGKPFPKPDHVQERDNLKGLDSIDPASLF